MRVTTDDVHNDVSFHQMRTVGAPASIWVHSAVTPRSGPRRLTRAPPAVAVSVAVTQSTSHGVSFASAVVAYLSSDPGSGQRERTEQEMFDTTNLLTELTRDLHVRPARHLSALALPAHAVASATAREFRRRRGVGPHAGGLWGQGIFWAIAARPAVVAAADADAAHGVTMAAAQRRQAASLLGQGELVLDVTGTLTNRINLWRREFTETFRFLSATQIIVSFTSTMS